MDETKKPINPNDLLIIQNIDNEDFEWQFDAIRTPLPYFIGAGQTRKLPYYIGYHGVNKLIDKVLQKQGKTHTSPLLRAELMEKIVLGLEHINLIREKSANEIALEEMQRKKDTDPLQELLKKREIEAERQRVAQLAAATPRAPMLETTGAPVAPTTTPVQPTVPADASPLSQQLDSMQAAAIDPQRQQVYDFLSTSAHLDLTHQATKEKFDSTPLDQLKAEFASEFPDIMSVGTLSPVVAPAAVEAAPTDFAPTPPAPANVSVSPIAPEPQAPVVPAPPVTPAEPNIPAVAV